MFKYFANSKIISCICMFVLWNIQHSTASITFNISDIPKYWITCARNSLCEGIIQFCDEDLGCRYCNKDVCESDPVPPQCYIKCLDLAQKDEKGIAKTTQIIPTSNNKDLTKPDDFNPWKLVTFLLLMLIVVLLGVMLRPVFQRHVKICAQKNTHCMEKQKTEETNKFILSPENGHIPVANRNTKSELVASGAKYDQDNQPCHV